MRRKCFIPDCQSKTGTTLFFTLPRNDATLDWWKKTSWSGEQKFPMRIRICERHFEDEYIDRTFKVPRLVRGAIPSLHVEPSQGSDFEWWEIEYDEPLENRLARYCRACGQQQAAQLDGNVKMLEELEQLLSLGLDLEDSELPKGMCETCITSLQQVINFRTQCVEGQEMLQKELAKQYEPTVLQELLGVEEETGCVEELYEADEEELKDEDDTEMEKSKKPLSDDLGALVSMNFEKSAASVDLDECPPTLAPSRKRERPSPEKKSSKNLETSTICPVCGKILMSKPNYTTHLKMHSGQRDHVCNICGKEFYIRRELLMHIESLHERKKFVCTVCGIKCQWRKGLQRHMKKHQDNAYKHKCQQCDKAFMAPNQLRLHMMKHTGDRLSCEICGVGYRFNYMLTQHKIRVHNMVFNGVKLYNTTRTSRKGRRASAKVKKEIDEEGEHQQYQLVDVIHSETE